MDLGSLSKAHPLPSALALTWRYRWLNCPVALPCRFALAVMGHLSWLATSSLGYHLGESDRVFGRSRVVGIESSVIGWLAVAFASQYQTKIERKLTATSEGILWLDGNEWLSSQNETSALISHSFSQTR